jgi:hypothetical protein
MATGLTDLKALERDAFRKFYDDGVFDCYVGIMLITMGVAAVFADQMNNEGLSMLLTLGLAIAVTVPLLLWRRHLLRSRLGEFKPGPARRRKISKTRLVLLGSVLLGVLAFVVATIAYRSDSSVDVIGLVIPLLWLLNSMVVFGGMAYLLDVPRFYAHGVIIGFAMPILIWPDVLWDTKVEPWLAFGLPGLIVVVVGLYKLAGFLRSYPVLTTEGAVDGQV